MSHNRTRNPVRAKTCAMPEPMVPAPRTATVWMSDIRKTRGTSGSLARWGEMWERTAQRSERPDASAIGRRTVYCGMRNSFIRWRALMVVWNRRSFLRAASVASAVSLLPGAHLLTAQESEPVKPAAANDHIQIALIGAGGQGQYDTKAALETPGTKLVAVADCYDGRLAHCKELWGDDIFTTRDYNEILARKDIDAVII